MSENLDINNNTATEPATEPEPTKAEPANEKLFTQEEVNEIIKNRLKRQGEKQKEAVADAAAEAEKALADKTVELNSRESRLDCKAYLIEKGYPPELLDVIDTSDTEKFKEKADTAVSTIGSKRKRSAPLASNDSPLTDATFTAAFKSGGKHQPKKFGGFDIE